MFHREICKRCIEEYSKRHPENTEFCRGVFKENWNDERIFCPATQHFYNIWDDTVPCECYYKLEQMLTDEQKNAPGNV